MKKLVLIDGNSIMNRAFYGIMGSKALTTKDGKYTNAVYGFLAILFKLIEDEYGNYKEYKLAIKFQFSPIAHVFPRTIFNSDEILKLKENDFVEKLDCKLHKKYNNISINNSDNYILLTERLSYGSPKVIPFNDRYIASTVIIGGEHSYRPKKITARGRTPNEAISRLKDRMEEELNIKKDNKENEHKNIEESIEDDFADIRKISC